MKNTILQILIVLTIVAILLRWIYILQPILQHILDSAQKAAR